MTVATLPTAPVRRPGADAWLTLIVSEAKMVSRDTAGLIVPLGLPLLILIMSATAAGDEVITGGFTALDLFVLPLVGTLVIATIGIINMPSFLAYYRHAGILRRLAVTPASPPMVLVAQGVVSLLQALLGLGLALTIAMTAFGANMPAAPWRAIGVFLLATAAMYALGMIVASVSPTPNSAVAIGLVLFFALGSLGGLFGGIGALPDWLQPIASWLPFGASVEALGAAWVGAEIALENLVSLAVTTVLGVTTAAVLFRWE